MKYRIMPVIGTRPQFVKASIVFAALVNEPDLDVVMVNSGQHYDVNLSELFVRELGIRQPDYNLDVGSAGNTAQTARIMLRLDEVLDREKPDEVLVFGDTNTTLGAALAARQHGIRLSHVEAGMRVGNLSIPEEFNRVVTDRISDRLYTASEKAVGNLKQEGISNELIHHCGDVMYDVLRKFLPLASPVDGLELEDDYILLTLHRAGNTDNKARLQAITEILENLAETVQIVCPLHPRTGKMLDRFGLSSRWNDCTRMIEPVGYLNMLHLVKHAGIVMTDSGGLQKEAFYLEVPCMTLRDETEWIELLELGWNRLVDVRDIAGATDMIKGGFGSRGQEAEPYGDGTAAGSIVRDILERLH